MGTRGDLVDHRPGEGDLCLVAEVVEEGCVDETILYPTLSISEDTCLHLVAIMRTVVHALDGEGEFTNKETFVEQGTDLTHRKEGLETSCKIGFVEGVALLRDGEGDHLQAGILEDFYQTVPIGELRISL